MKLAQGTTIFHAGQACPGYVTVLAGSVKVVLTGENGREIVLYRIGPGDICLQTFACLVNGTLYSADGIAETEVEFDIMPPDAFARQAGEDAAFRERLFAAVAVRFAQLERLVEDVALLPVQIRLARLLLRLADSAGRITATQEQLAAEIGSVREVVNRQLNALARDGVLDMQRGAITVLAPGRLRDLASFPG